MFEEKTKLFPGDFKYFGAYKIYSKIIFRLVCDKWKLSS